MKVSIRVGVVGPVQEDDFAANILDGFAALKIPASGLGEPIPDALGRRGRAVVQTLRRDPRLGPRLEQGIVRRARDLELELVVTVMSLRPETVRALVAGGARVVLWFPDHVANLGALWMFDAPYTGLFFKEPVLVQRLNSLLDLPVHYLPEACNPLIHRPSRDEECVGKVAVVGNLHAIRARLLERLVDDGVPLAIYGPPSHAHRYPSLAPFHTGRYIRGKDKSAVFGSAAAVLNNLHPAEMEGVNCRLFEATAAGGAVMVEHRQELDNLFDLQDEIRSFQSYDDLVEVLGTVLNDRALRDRLGRAASARSLRDHTYTNRLADLLARTL
jgi:spore maturation protein CgeB